MSTILNTVHRFVGLFFMAALFFGTLVTSALGLIFDRYLAVLVAVPAIKALFVIGAWIATGGFGLFITWTLLYLIDKLDDLAIEEEYS